jgi:hypothetical protein
MDDNNHATVGIPRKDPTILGEIYGFWRQTRVLIGVWWIDTRKILAGAAATLALFAAIVTLFTGLTIEPRGNPNFASGSFGTFAINNVGVIPLWNLSVWVGLCQILYKEAPNEPPVGDCKGPIKSLFHPVQWGFRRLRMDDPPIIVTADDEFAHESRPITSANVSIVVYYHPWFLPWTKKAQVRLKTRDIGGELIWFTIPEDNE